MQERIEKKRQAVLKVLQEANRPLSSIKITRQLRDMGYEVSGRTVRLYLKRLDHQGLTRNQGKRGRSITVLGSQELSAEKTFEKVGFMAARIDQMTYNMTFDITKKTGTVIVNVSVLPKAKLKRSISLMKSVFASGYSMGKLLAIFKPEEQAGGLVIPEDCLGIGTVCSVTLNGVLLAHGIPTNSRFGGLLEIQDKQPKRFVELIHYDGTTIDPLEVFIRTGMTDYLGATTTGNGRIGVGFRELPADSRRQVLDIANQLEQMGLGGFMSIGWPGQPLLGIPVSEGRVGAIVIGGLNPIAILEEYGIRTVSRALANLIEYQRLFHYRELDAQLRQAL